MMVRKERRSRRRRAVLFGLLCGICGGCSFGNAGAERPLVVIDGKKDAGNEELLRFVSFERLFPVRSDSLVIGNIQKMAVHDSSIYLLDSQREVLVVLDLQGVPSLVLDKKGEGPDEYLSMSDFAVDEAGNLLILDSDAGRILWYDATGSFIRKIEVGLATEILLLPERRIAVYRNILSDKLISVYADDGKLLQEYTTPVPIPDLLLGDNGRMAERGGELFFVNPFDYTVYALADTACIPFVRFDFPEKNLNADFLKETNRRVLIKWMQQNMDKILSLDNLCFYKELLIVKPTPAGDLIFYDTKERISYVFNDLRLPVSALLSAPIYIDREGAFVGTVSSSHVVNGIWPVWEESLSEYPFLQALRREDIDDYPDNDWIVTGRFR